MTWEEKQIKYAREHFTDFKADFKDYGEIQTLDWRNKDGSSNHHVRYVFDTEQKYMYVSGDLGAAAFFLTWEPTFENMKNKINQMSYITGKIECSTDKYCYPTAYVNQDIDEWYEDREPKKEDYSDYEQYLEDLEEFEEFINAYKRSYDHHNGFQPDAEDMQIIENFDEEWWDKSDFGKVIDTRVFCWFVGLQMAWEQLHKEENHG